MEKTRITDQELELVIGNQGFPVERKYVYGRRFNFTRLTRAYLSAWTFDECDFIGADFSLATFESCMFANCNIERTKFHGSSMLDTSFISCDMSTSRLDGMMHHNITLRGSKVPDWFDITTRITPTGDLIGWKKCRSGTIVKLLIPEDAKRSNALGRKCRAECAKVLEIWGTCGVPIEHTRSQYDPTFIYRVGETVRHNGQWCEDRWTECAPGIHFFITREEAEAW